MFKLYKYLLEKYITTLKPILLVQAKFITYHLTIIFSVNLIYLFIYARFIRERLPRDIPFQLTLYGFCLLLFICGVYIYLIKSLINPESASSTAQKLKTFFAKPVKYFVESLYIIDHTIKNNFIVKSYYDRIKEILVLQIATFSYIERVAFLYGFIIVPGYILLSIFMVDVFHLNKINIFYYFIFLQVLPLLYRYYNYSLNKIVEEYFTFLESQYDYIKITDENSVDIPLRDRNIKAIYHQEEVSIREYFKIQLEQFDIEWLQNEEKNWEAKEITYVGHAYAKDHIYFRYRQENNKLNQELMDEDYEILQQNFKDTETKLLNLLIYLDANKYTSKLYYIKELRIMLYFLYFITWTYILLKSLHTLPENAFHVLRLLIPRYENPFI